MRVAYAFNGIIRPSYIVC